MRYTFGLIGSGNMGGAIARAVSLTLKDGILADHSPQRAQELPLNWGFPQAPMKTRLGRVNIFFWGSSPT